MIEAAQPLVSVVIPTYNHAHFLGRALRSVLNQTYSNWEAIVIDNHSRDNTDQVIQSFNDPRISALKIHNNGIIAASRNAGIRVAKGEWIAFLDSDDLWYPQKLDIAVKAVMEDTMVDVCSTDEFLVNELAGDKSVLEYGPCSPNLYQALLVEGNRFSPSAAIVRRGFLSLTDIVFRENKEFVTAEDYDLWMLLARAGAKFKCIRSVQGEYRIHANNSSGQIEKHSQNTGNVIRDHVYRLQTFEADKDRLWRSINARLLVTRSKNLIMQKQVMAGIGALGAACRSSGPSTLRYIFSRFIKTGKSSR